MEVKDLDEPREPNPNIEADYDFALCFRHRADDIESIPLAQNNKGVLLRRKKVKA